MVFALVCACALALKELYPSMHCHLFHSGHPSQLQAESQGKCDRQDKTDRMRQPADGCLNAGLRGFACYQLAQTAGLSELRALTGLPNLLAEYCFMRTDSQLQSSWIVISLGMSNHSELTCAALLFSHLAMQLHWAMYSRHCLHSRLQSQGGIRLCRSLAAVRAPAADLPSSLDLTKSII